MPSTAYQRDYGTGKKTPGQKRDMLRQNKALAASRRKKKTV